MKTFALAAAIYSLIASSTVRAQYAIDPSSVPLSMRQYWCTQQKTECPLICLQTSANSDVTEQNQCDPNALTYSCICSNGLSPNVTQYSQTLPYFICTEWGTQCVSNCVATDPNNSTCASECREDHPCGAQDPVRVNTSTITSTTTRGGGKGGSHQATTTSGGGTVCTGFGSDACGSAQQTGGSSSSSSDGGSHSAASSSLTNALRSGQTLGLVLLVGAFFLGFALVL